MRSGDGHEGMKYFGLSAAGTPDPTIDDCALRGTHHEHINRLFLQANGPAPNPQPWLSPATSISLVPKW
jgi:hypothetical protein